MAIKAVKMSVVNEFLKTITNETNVREFAMNRGVNNALLFGACEERICEKIFEDLGYQRKTTFWSDMSIAEFYSVDAVKDTCKRVIKEWFTNKEYFTEFVMVINHKSWEWYERGNAILSQVYIDLYYFLRDLVFENWSDEELKYYLEITD